MLIDDLRHAVQGFWRDADVLPFGSFPAGLYLPTADMDLVVVSRDYMSGGYGRYTAKSSLFRLRSMLVDKRIAAYNSVEVISKAKVPLVKYIDQYTGLRIDVSFENDTGLIANKTFQEWKRQYPAMPILVTIIKQYLAMRGLNEPVNGGIGGFTVTCLVVSLLQMMPQIQSGSMTPEHHLGEILMEFFDLYGNQFNVQTTAIRLNPPGYVRKVCRLELPMLTAETNHISHMQERLSTRTWIDSPSSIPIQRQMTSQVVRVIPPRFARHSPKPSTISKSACRS
jgi:non-canonical poly(A) RNA polymerase PAPD5/7